MKTIEERYKGFRKVLRTAYFLSVIAIPVCTFISLNSFRQGNNIIGALAGFVIVIIFFFIFQFRKEMELYKETFKNKK